MIVFNFCGEPGAGKSTIAAWFYSELKKAGFEAELVGETARDYIYLQGKAPLYDNQFLVSGQQWERLFRLSRCNVPIAVSDSPVMQGLLYAEHLPYYPELKAILEVCNKQFETYNIWINRAWAYERKNRNQTEEEALALSRKAKALCAPIWLEVKGDALGLSVVYARALELLKAGDLRGGVLSPGTQP